MTLSCWSDSGGFICAPTCVYIRNRAFCYTHNNTHWLKYQTLQVVTCNLKMCVQFCAKLYENQWITSTHLQSCEMLANCCYVQYNNNNNSLVSNVHTCPCTYVSFHKVKEFRQATAQPRRDQSRINTGGQHRRLINSRQLSADTGLLERNNVCTNIGAHWKQTKQRTCLLKHTNIHTWLKSHIASYCMNLTKFRTVLYNTVWISANCVQ